MRWQFGDTITLHRRTVVGQDPYGDDIYAETNTTVEKCAVWPKAVWPAPSGSLELTNAQTLVLDGLWIVVPEDIDIQATDELTVRGERHEIEGAPARLESPLTGTFVGWQVASKKVTG